MVAALDFGTTYSGYAFSMRSEFKTDPLKIHSNQTWNAGARALSSIKTPTCLLLDKEKKFVAFDFLLHIQRPQISSPYQATDMLVS